MIRAAFRGTAREHLIAVALALLVAICCLLLTGVPAHGADQADGSAIRAYNPFNDPKPAVPAEMLSDKRLDRKVRVSVKSKGLNQFLADLSAKTGVKLSADPKVQAERPIICCNGRSLRDLLTEISGLYGYTWRAVPDRGGYRYDLFEDAPHMKLRTAQSRESARNATRSKMARVSGASSATGLRIVLLPSDLKPPRIGIAYFLPTLAEIGRGHQRPRTLQPGDCRIGRPSIMVS